jgi:hypothetical protein
MLVHARRLREEEGENLNALDGGSSSSVPWRGAGALVVGITRSERQVQQGWGKGDRVKGLLAV